MSLPLTIAASNFDVVIYILAGVVWVVFQLISRVNKGRQEGTPTPGDQDTEQLGPRPVNDDLKELMEMLSGRRLDEPRPPEPLSRPPVTEEPSPRPVLPPPPLRPRPSALPRPSAYVAKTTPRTTATVKSFKQRPTRVPLPPLPSRRPAPRPSPVELAAVPEPAAPEVPVPLPVPDAYVHSTKAEMQAQLHVTPLMRMRWPTSPLGQMTGVMSRPSRQSSLRKHLQGRRALRQAMVSRLVLGPPGGR